jgi:hypothetical protein
MQSLTLFNPYESNLSLCLGTYQVIAEPISVHRSLSIEKTHSLLSRYTLSKNAIIPCTPSTLALSLKLTIYQISTYPQVAIISCPPPHECNLLYGLSVGTCYGSLPSLRGVPSLRCTPFGYWRTGRRETRNTSNPNLLNPNHETNPRRVHIHAMLCPSPWHKPCHMASDLYLIHTRFECIWHPSYEAYSLWSVLTLLSVWHQIHHCKALVGRNVTFTSVNQRSNTI